MCVLQILACGKADKKSSHGSAQPWESSAGFFVNLPSALQNLPQATQGLTWYFAPGNATPNSTKPNLFLRIAGLGNQSGSKQAAVTLPVALVWGPSVTVAGYHWPWEGDGAVLRFSQNGLDPILDKGASLVPLAQLAGKSLSLPSESPVNLAFHVPTGSYLQQRWPAVVGMREATAGVFSPLAASLVRFSDLSLPQRLYVLDSNLLPIKNVTSPMALCGTGCFDAKNFLEFVESPVSYGGLPLFKKRGEYFEFIFPVGSLQSQKLAESLVASQDFTQGLDNLFSSFNQNIAKVFSPSRKFQLHVSLSAGCQYQGLEHFYATLLSFGGNCGSKSYNPFTLLVAHEAIHVWNAKHIFSAETFPHNVVTFSPNRNRQLFMFEGFTEGLARLSLGVFWPKSVPLQDRLDLWNKSFHKLFFSPLFGKSAEQISLADPQLGYHLGAFMALWAAHLASTSAELGKSLEQQFGNWLLPTQVPKSRSLVSLEKLQSVLRSLGHTGFLPQSSAFQQIVFSPFILKLKEGAGMRGYTVRDLRKIFAEMLSLPADADFLTAFFPTAGVPAGVVAETALGNKDKFFSLVQSIAAANSLTLAVPEPKDSTLAPEIVFPEGESEASFMARYEGIF